MKRVRYLSQARIEASTLALLAGYGRKYGPVLQPPIPVEEILEAHLGLDFEFDDLAGLLGIPDVLGATWIQQRSVKIDQSLDPTVDPSKEGRYRFTVSHEVGHWELHRPLFPYQPGQGSLFSEVEQPIVCRSGVKNMMERQADRFAAYLLMPTKMVLEVWPAVYRGVGPYMASDEIAELHQRWRLEENDCPTVRLAREMAREFKVSGQAMQIRLIGLGLIQTEPSEPGLFVT